MEKKYSLISLLRLMTYQKKLLITQLCAFAMFAFTAVGQTTIGASPFTVSSNGTYVLPPGYTSMTIEVWGGGGGGGGSSSSTFNANNRGAGGGGGGYSIATVTGVAANDVYTITIGAGGAGRSNDSGLPGGASTVTKGATTIVTAGGGGGGNRNSGTPGAGGSGQNTGGAGRTVASSGGGGGGGGAGNYSPYGGLGNGGTGTANSTGSTGGQGGTGGGTTAVAGGNGGNGNTGSDHGSPGIAPAGGGGGGRSHGIGGGAKSGGTGGAGRVRITYSCITPTIGTLPAAACQGSTITLTGTNFAVGGTTVTFTGASAVAATVTSSTSLDVVIPTSATTGPITITTCTASAPSGSYTINELPGTPGAFTTTSATVCQGQSNVTYTAGTSTNSPTSYTWSYSGTGATFNGGNSTLTPTNTVSFATNATAGTISVVGVNSCGSSATPRTQAVTMNLLPGTPAAFVTAPTTLCAGSALQYVAGVSSNGTSYTWSSSGFGGTAPTFSTNPSTSASVTATFAGTTGSGTIIVHGTNACGNSLSSNSTATITVTPNVPSTPGGFTTAPSPVCQGATGVDYIAGAASGATSYTWTSTIGGGGATFTSNTPSPSNTFNFSTTATNGIINIYGTNVCGNSASPASTPTITVNQLPTVNAGPAVANLCQGNTTLALGGSVGGGATGGTWSDGLSGGSAGSFTNNNPANALYTASASAPGTVTLTLTTSGGFCGTTS
ncbi:MAG TPA: hypothetical protein VK154_15465, partial [Chitinophagales bacterium]|nr:hypothetical protein [Chitinophagales bacterium]